jgi:hypothetical protein
VALDDGRVRLGDDILVLHRHGRDVEAEHGAGLAHVVARRRDQMLARDVALVGAHQPLARRRLLDAGDGGLAVDLAPPSRAPLASAWVRSAGWM